MPELSLWGLVIAFGMLAIGLTLKNTDIRRRLKHAEEDLSRARSKAQPSEKRFNKEIADVKELYERQINELSQTIADLKSGIPEKPKFTYNNNLLWLSDDLASYCPSCYEIDGKQIQQIQHWLEVEYKRLIMYNHYKFKAMRSDRSAKSNE